MNETIKELAEQAGFYIPQLPYLEGDDAKILRIEKFAEFIVRECLRIQHERFCEHGHDVSPDVVLEHFGFKTYWDRQLELFNERKD